MTCKTIQTYKYAVSTFHGICRISIMFAKKNRIHHCTARLRTPSDTDTGSAIDFEQSNVRFTQVINVHVHDDDTVLTISYQRPA